MHQALSLCRDGLRVLNTLATDAVCRGKGLEEFRVFHWRGFIFVGAPIVILVTVCSVVKITISEQAQAIDNKHDYMITKGLPILRAVLGGTTYCRNDMFFP